MLPCLLLQEKTVNGFLSTLFEQRDGIIAIIKTSTEPTLAVKYFRRYGALEGV